jgi:hypothetical protein
MPEEIKPAEEIAGTEEVKVEELDDENLEDASGGGDNSGCNCNCGQN